MILEMSFLSAKMSKEKKKIGQVGLSWSSSGPDSTPKQAPIRPGDRKTCQSQTSKKLKFRCRPSTLQEPTTNMKRT